MAGNVAWSFETFSATLPLHRAGKLKILAFCHSKRATIAPEIPNQGRARQVGAGHPRRQGQDRLAGPRQGRLSLTSLRPA